MNPFSFYEVQAGSWLHRRNPTAKLAAHLLVSGLLTLVFDPLTPLAFLLAALGIGRLLGRVPPGLVLRALAPFWALGLSLALSNALFANQPERATLLWAWGPFTATAEGLWIGVSLGERALAVAAFSVLLVATTDPTDLVRSLVQQARLPSRVAYPALAALRFLPLLRDELETLRLARRLRGQGRSPGPAGWLREQRRLLVPLLASAIRRADRVAVAMEARGFGSARPRTHYRRLTVGAADVALVAGAALGGAAILLVSAGLGVLRLWNGTLGA